MRSASSNWFVVVSVGATSLASCDFSDTIDIGRDGGSGGQQAPTATSGRAHGGSDGGAGSASGGTSHAGVAGLSFGAQSGSGIAIPGGGGGGASGCAVGAQPTTHWVSGTDAALSALSSGVGGLLYGGQYQLQQLVEHGTCPCFDIDGVLAQTLYLSDDGTGFVITDYQSGAHYESKFKFVIDGNQIRIDPTCSEPAEAPRAPFGSFETYTATGDTLSLFSTACSYRAQYQLSRVPSR